MRYWLFCRIGEEMHEEGTGRLDRRCTETGRRQYCSGAGVMQGKARSSPGAGEMKAAALWLAGAVQLLAVIADHGVCK